MKKHIRSILLCLIIAQLVFTFDVRAVENELNSAADNFCEALKNGDTAALRLLVSEDMLRRRKQLLTNREYSGFLKEYYKNAEFKVTGFNPRSENLVYVDVEIRLNDGTFSTTALSFGKKGGNWKVIEEINK
jgi:hypothetical protein